MWEQTVGFGSPDIVRGSSPIVPAQIAAVLAHDFGEREGSEYLLYERADEVILALGTAELVELDSDELRVTRGSVTKRHSWSGRPADALGDAIDRLLVDNEQVFGWIAFEFGLYRLGLQDRLPPGTPLARLLRPRALVAVGNDGIRLAGTDDRHETAIQRIIADGLPAIPAATGIDPVGDSSGFREAVDKAVAEIQSGSYDKVVLSRRVDVPFAVDFPATYRLGRPYNTPVRSFLLRLGGVRALGFSPELVAAVHGGGAVITEPLAGTRALGHGRARDRQAREDLESNAKEIVEHAISVRTSLREMGEVCDPGTAAVTEFMTVLNTGAPTSERAAKLAGGAAAVPTADNIANQLNSYGGMVSWQVQNPVLNGDQLDAQLAVTIPIFGTKSHNIYWVNQDGAWKLSNPSACVIANDVAGVSCTV